MVDTTQTSRQLRILMVTGIYPTDTRPHSGTFIKSQVDSLLEAGLDVEVIHPKPGPTALRYVAATVQVFRKTLKGQVDIVHGHYGLWCLASCMQWKAPTVASFLGDDLLGTPTSDGKLSKKSLFVVRLSQRLSRHVSAVIIKSAEMKQATNRQDSYVIPNGVDFALFCQRSRSEARQVLGWQQGRAYVLFANDPEIPRKNYALAQAAIQKLQDKGVAVELVVANGLPQTTVVQYINACNVLVLPSLSEGSPNIVKETMACNVPVVATDVGDVAAVIGHTAGCTVCPFDADAIALAMEKAIQHTEPTTGREDIRHLDRQIVAKQVIAVYEQVRKQHMRKRRWGGILWEMSKR